MNERRDTPSDCHKHSEDSREPVNRNEGGEILGEAEPGFPGRVDTCDAAQEQELTDEMNS